jgi:hypothetical protein
MELKKKQSNVTWPHSQYTKDILPQNLEPDRQRDRQAGR